MWVVVEKVLNVGRGTESIKCWSKYRRLNMGRGTEYKGGYITVSSHAVVAKAQQGNP